MFFFARAAFLVAAYSVVGGLLADAVTRSRNAALSVGSAGIFVDAKNDKAARVYSQYGFTACKEQPLKLYLPMW